MTNKPTLVLAFLVLTTLGVAASGSDSFILVNGMVEGPDPIPTDWDGVLSATAGETPDFGTAEIEFPADAAYQPGSGNPAVIWEYPSGDDRDIAFSIWTGADWDKTEYLSSSLHDERDPRLVFDGAGVAFAVWWQDVDGGRVHLARRTAAGDWLPPSVWNGASPDLAVHAGVAHVLFERPSSRGMEIVHLRAESGGELEEETLVRTRRAVSTLVGFHAQDGRLWARWQHNPTQVGWSELVNGRWVAPSSLP